MMKIASWPIVLVALQCSASIPFSCSFSVSARPPSIKSNADKKRSSWRLSYSLRRHDSYDDYDDFGRSRRHGHDEYYSLGADELTSNFYDGYFGRDEQGDYSSEDSDVGHVDFYHPSNGNMDGRLYQIGSHDHFQNFDDADNYHNCNDNYVGHGHVDGRYSYSGRRRHPSHHHHDGGGGGSLNALSVTELKRLLDDRRVDYRDCLEKRDLIDRLLSSRAPDAGYYNVNSNDYGRAAAGDLAPEENRVVNVFTKASPSVAYIQTVQQQPVIRGLSLKGTEVPTGAGSGFVWDDRGHIVTNYHVIASAIQSSSSTPRIKVKLQGILDPLDAAIVGYEPEKDLAVLKLQLPSSTNTSSNRFQLPPPLAIGTSSTLQVGQSVLAIGNPFGLDYTLTTGVVSALGRDVQGIGGRPIKGCIQSDAAINPGNSGGPLLDSKGRLIGVNMAIYSPSGASAGIGFSIPVDTVRRVVMGIIKHGKAVRPSLGVNVAEDRVVQSIEMQLRRKLRGVLVAEVLKGSPADVAGMEASVLNYGDGTMALGDLITSVNGEEVVCVEDLLSAIEAKAEGEWVEVEVWRKCDSRLKERLRVKLTCSSKLSNGNGGSVAGPSNRGPTASPGASAASGISKRNGSMSSSAVGSLFGAWQ